VFIFLGFNERLRADLDRTRSESLGNMISAVGLPICAASMVSALASKARLPL
jgi:hypothetical protein